MIQISGYFPETESSIDSLLISANVLRDERPLDPDAVISSRPSIILAMKVHTYDMYRFLLLVNVSFFFVVVRFGSMLVINLYTLVNLVSNFFPYSPICSYVLVSIDVHTDARY